jgi:multiple sugar transport system permease protein
MRQTPSAGLSGAGSSPAAAPDRRFWPEVQHAHDGLAFSGGQLDSGTQYPVTLGAAVLSMIPVAIILFRYQRQFVGGDPFSAVMG